MALHRIRKNKIANVVSRIILFSIFILLCLVLSYRYVNSTSGITILIHEHSLKDITAAKTAELLKGEKIKGVFQAQDNYIGIVSVRFNTFFRINSDTVIFRIKEKGAENWYYEHGYLVNQFQPNKYFTFGFPIINDSKNKEYEFEIQSTIGSPGDAVALSPIEPVFTSKYQYPKDRILNDSDFLVTFSINKTINSLTDINFLISLIVYLLPLIIYIIKLFFFDKYFADRHIVVLIPLVAMLILCFVNVPRSDEAVVGAIGLWMVLSITYRLKSSVSFIVALIFLCVTPVLLYSGASILASNFAMWGYMMMVAGVLLQLIEIIWRRKNLYDITSFIKSQE